MRLSPIPIMLEVKTKVIMRPRWLRLTEETNALDYLERASQFIRETEDNLVAWKWVVLSLHGALYGFAICACKGTNSENVIFRNKKGKEKLIGFNEALKKCQDSDWMRMLHGSKAITLSKAQRQSIQLLKQVLRNNIEHYIPKGWSIGVHGLPQMALDILDVIRFLVVETDTYVNLKPSEIRKVKSIVYQSKRFL